MTRRARPLTSLKNLAFWEGRRLLAKWQRWKVRLPKNRTGPEPEVPPVYREVGQPVLIPGSMGTASYLLAGGEASMRESFGSSCHGAGRVMSRMRAKKEIDGHELRARLERMGIIAEAASTRGLVEEAPEAYKDVDAVVDVVARAGIATKVARLKPVAVVKG